MSDKQLPSNKAAERFRAYWGERGIKMDLASAKRAGNFCGTTPYDFEDGGRFAITPPKEPDMKGNYLNYDPVKGTL